MGPVEIPHAGEIDGDVEVLLDAVHERGEELLHQRTYSAAQRYRTAIRSFLRRVVPEAVSIESHDSSHGILNRKRYTLLAELDQRVDRLVRGVLQAQSKQIEIVARLKEIEGLLVDLLH